MTINIENASNKTKMRIFNVRTLKIIREQTALVLLIFLVFVGSQVSDVFLTGQNLLNIIWAVSVLGIVSLGQCILIIACRFDMSVAYSLGLCGIVMVVLFEYKSDTSMR